MEILKYRKDANSPWQDIAAIVGPMGPQGEPGKDGVIGKDGKDGYTPIKGVDYFDGEQGPQGIQGEPGEKGADGAPGKDGADGKPFTYEDFTPEQLEALRGPEGIQGPAGEKGEPGTTNYSELDNQPILVVDVLPEPTEDLIGNLYKTPTGLYKLTDKAIWKVPEVGDKVYLSQTKTTATLEEMEDIYTNNQYGDTDIQLTLWRRPEVEGYHNDINVLYSTAGYIYYQNYLGSLYGGWMEKDEVYVSSCDTYVDYVNTDSALYGKILVNVGSEGLEWVEAFDNGISEEERQSIIDEVIALIPNYTASEEVSF